MTFDPSDMIDWNMMHTPPRFASKVGNTVVVTDGQDFPGLVVQWPDALEEERADDFWALGLLHLAEVEVVKLPPEARTDAISKLAELDRHDPRALAGNVAAIVRQIATNQPGIASTRFALTQDEMKTYRKLLIIRATAPYVGSDAVNIVNIGGGSMIAA